MHHADAEPLIDHASTPSIAPGMADTTAVSPTCGATAAPVLGKPHSREDDAARLPCSAARSLPQPSCRVVRGWEFDARDVNSSNMYAVLHDECDDTDENVHIDYDAMIRDRYHANGWVRQARRSSVPPARKFAHRLPRHGSRQVPCGWLGEAGAAPLSPATSTKMCTSTTTPWFATGAMRMAG